METQLPLPQKGAEPPNFRPMSIVAKWLYVSGYHRFLVHLYCGQMAGWMRTQFGTEVDLGSSHIVFDGDLAPPQNGHSSPFFSAHIYFGTVAHLSYF